MSRIRYVEVRLTKCLIVLTEAEFNGMLQKDPALWEQAIRRGKVILRHRAAEKRNKGREL